MHAFVYSSHYWNWIIQRFSSYRPSFKSLWKTLQQHAQSAMQLLPFLKKYRPLLISGRRASCSENGCLRALLVIFVLYIYILQRLMTPRAVFSWWPSWNLIPLSSLNEFGWVKLMLAYRGLQLGLCVWLYWDELYLFVSWGHRRWCITKHNSIKLVFYWLNSSFDLIYKRCINLLEKVEYEGFFVLVDQNYHWSFF